MVRTDLPDLSQRLESFRPRSLLAIGRRAGDWLAPYCGAHRDCSLTRIDAGGELTGDALLETLSSHGRFDFALMVGVLERLEPEDSAHLIARLRDLNARRFSVIVDAAAADRWQASDLIAMGLDHWSSGMLEGLRVDVYGFDVGTYKVTPDWLNPRHWAHPEHWGKYRW